MEISQFHRHQAGYPQELEKVHKPPATLYCRGRDIRDIMSRPRVAIVGSRRMTPYGRQVTRKLAQQLAEHGVVIVSGLALGVDAEAHQAAIDAKGITMAVLPTPVEAPGPATNFRLAERILAIGGSLVSTYPAGSVNHKGNFVERNQYVAALSDLIIITEAAQGSGSLHTAQFAADMGVEVMAVPGNITSATSVGTNNLLRTGVGMVLNVQDVLGQLGLTDSTRTTPLGANPEEQCILNLIVAGESDGDNLLVTSEQTVSTFNQTLTMLEISGKIRALGGNQWGLS